MFIIYLITNLVNGKVYVGQTRSLLRRRWATHKCDARRGEPLYICRALRKYGEDSFTIRPIDFAETQEKADFLEETWIFLHASLTRGKGYNIRTGGHTSPGMSPEGKERVSRAHRGKIVSAESRKLTSEGNKRAWAEGRLHGRPHTQAARKKMSDGQRGSKGHNFRSDILDEELVDLWNNDTPVSELTKRFSAATSTIINRIKASGLDYKPFGVRTVKGPRREPLTEVDKQHIAEFWSDGVSQVKIAETLKCHPTTVSHVLRRLRECNP